MGRFFILARAAAAALGIGVGAGLAAGSDAFLRDYAETRGFSLGHPIKAQPTPDGRAVLFLRAESRLPRFALFEFDAASGVTRRLLAPNDAPRTHPPQTAATPDGAADSAPAGSMSFTDFQLDASGRRVLLRQQGGVVLFDRDTGRSWTPPLEANAVDPRLSPDGRLIAYVRDFDLHVLDLERPRAWPVTRDGSARLSHGLAELAAREEMNRPAGYWWSPDSRWIAYEEADAAEVEAWYLADPLAPAQRPRVAFYPRPGHSPVKVRLGVVSARGGKTLWIDWDAARFPYLARVDWHPQAGLTLTVQSRDQREVAVLRANPRSGRTDGLLTETDPAWVNLDPQVPHWLDDGSGFLWTSERQGAWQLELRDRQGAMRRVLVPPTVGYQGLLSVDSPRGEVHFQASADPTQTHLYRVPLAGGAPTPLTEEPGLHRAVYAANHGLYVHQYSGPETFMRQWVRFRDGSTAGELPSVAERPEPPRPEWVRLEEPFAMQARLVRPRRAARDKPLPVLVHVYGGPHTQLVQQEVASVLLDQWLADQGFLVVSMDGRGTPHRGREWERAIQGQLGRIPLTDQLTGLSALGRRYPELDLTRVGIFGWSFGGYLAALAVLERPDVFRAAVAGAPVADWSDYSAHYTERYLGLPAEQPEAYTAASLLPAKAVQLSRPLLLFHGSADDNVYFQHTLRLVDALLRAGKEFEVLPLPGSGHAVTDPVTTEQLWLRTSSFFAQHLQQR